MKLKTKENNVFQLAAQSTERIQKYINQDHNESFLKSIKSGSIPLLNPNYHEFVDRIHDKNPPIYNKHYKPAVQRAQEAQDSFLQGHLKAGPYRKIPLNMRPELLANEKMPLRYGKNPRTENERLQESMQSSTYLDYTQKDMSMAQRPNWKPQQKDKWINESTFRSEANNFNSKYAWDLIKYRNQQDNYIYMEQENELIEFKRMRSDDLKNRLPFNPVIKKNPYSTYSTSIRTFKQDQAFGIENKTLFSQNSKLKHYKTALIATKSLDHIIPYNHSNNLQAIKNLFPNPNKQYLKSTQQMGQQLKQHQIIHGDYNLDSQEPIPIQEYPQPDDFNNTNFEKTRYPQQKKQDRRFNPYNDQEAKQIVDKYFDKSFQ